MLRKYQCLETNFKQYHATNLRSTNPILPWFNNIALTIQSFLENVMFLQGAWKSMQFKLLKKCQSQR